MQEQVLIIIDTGDDSVGMLGQEWRIPLPFNIEDLEEETLIGFQNGIVELYKKFTNGKIIAVYERAGSPEPEQPELTPLTDEELKTIVGRVLCDLRGNWGDHYKERVDLVTAVVEELIRRNPADTDLRHDAHFIYICDDYSRDGRIFRNCKLYGYLSEAGKTDAVRAILAKYLTFPEHYQI